MTLEPLEIPDKLEPFIMEKHRFKVAYGGRGSAKSWTIARMLLMMGFGRKMRILCAREIMKSVDESVHQLLRDQIVNLGLTDHYEVQKSTIIGKNGTQFLFAGLRHNIGSIKSKEGIDLVWVEEATDVTFYSWETLIPTIRKEGSEIWVSFNPDLDDDDTYRRFIDEAHFLEGQLCSVEMNWRDNPWWTKTLDQARLTLKRQNPQEYLTIYEGKTRQVLEGAIFAEQILAATEEGRILDVPYIKGTKVHTFWDLGWSDLLAIWFVQIVGLQYRIVDFYEARRTELGDVLKLLDDKPYLYGIDYLPHDGASEYLASGGRSVQEQLETAGRDVEIVPRVPNKGVAINAARSVFPHCAFDRTRCKQGLDRLRRYAYKIDKQTGRWSRVPIHDDNSHASDAFEAIGLMLAPPEIRTAPTRYGFDKKRSRSWITA